MVGFSECNWMQITDTVYSCTSRLCVIGVRDPALIALADYCDALCFGDMPRASACYHALTSVLLNKRPHRVSGSIFTDYLIDMAVMGEHAFSLMAASGENDAAIFSAAACDLSLLCTLSKLTGKTLIRIAVERYREVRLKPRQAKDSISLKSAAIWSGATTRPLPQAENPSINEMRAPVPVMDFNWAQWESECALLDGIISTELEELYARFMKASDWADLVSDLYTFFDACGTGMFLSERQFSYANGKLTPLKCSASPMCACLIHEQERSELIENTIRFMRGEHACSMLLYGESGSGKTAQIMSIPDELPEVRLVVTNASEYAAFGELFNILSRQPLRFILLIDGINMRSSSASQLSSHMMGGRSVPKNVLLYGTSDTCGMAGLFPVALELKCLSVSDVTALSCEMLSLDGIEPDARAVSEMALELQSAPQSKLTCSSAVMLASRYKFGINN